MGRKRIKFAECRSNERVNRTKTVLMRRHQDFTVVLENINDPHNLSAVLRTCDAVGVLKVYLVYYGNQPFPKLSDVSSASAKKWIETIKFDSIEECFANLRGQGYKIFTTHLSKNAKSIYDINFLSKTAIVFGNEHLGVSEKALELADGNVLIPQVGMLQSLNISVAAAVTLYEAFRQRAAAGLIEKQTLSENDFDLYLNKWLSM